MTRPPKPPRESRSPRDPRPRPRRALKQHHAPVELRGEGDLPALLEQALLSTGADPDAGTHGFHTYSARMHWGIARTLIRGCSAEGGRVLDPFCGSGTVLIEALVAGRRAVGVDLNPLALRIAEVQCALRDPASRERFARTLAQVTQASLARVRARAKVSVPLSQRERTYYEPHVMLELAGLRAEIAAVAEPEDMRALQIVFSALVVKFSRQRADSSDAVDQKRIRKGLVSEFFERKGNELCARWALLWEATPRSALPPVLLEGDARELPKVLAHAREAPGFDLVVTSPPYGGTYDYYQHHARRYPWLGLTPQAFEANEIGARRRLTRVSGARARWDQELSAVLRAIARVCRRDARIVLLLGDAQLDEVRVSAREQVARLAPGAGLTLIASASQRRPDHLGGPPREEHLLALALRSDDR